MPVAEVWLDCGPAATALTGILRQLTTPPGIGALPSNPSMTVDFEDVGLVVRHGLAGNTQCSHVFSGTAAVPGNDPAPTRTGLDVPASGST
jgi:hypothetical protein